MKSINGEATPMDNSKGGPLKTDGSAMSVKCTDSGSNTGDMGLCSAKPTMTPGTIKDAKNPAGT